MPRICLTSYLDQSITIHKINLYRKKWVEGIYVNMECGNEQGTFWDRWVQLFWWALVDIMEHTSECRIWVVRKLSYSFCISHLTLSEGCFQGVLLPRASGPSCLITLGGEWDSGVCSGMPLVCMEITSVHVTWVGHCQCLLWWANGTDQINHRLHPPSSADHGQGTVQQDLPLGFIHSDVLRFTKRIWRGAVSIYFSCPMWTERWTIRLS